MNKKSIEFVIKKGEYIPIENRAAQIHSQHLTQIILNEEMQIALDNYSDLKMRKIDKITCQLAKKKFYLATAMFLKCFKDYQKYKVDRGM